MLPKINQVINKAVELDLFSGCVLIAKGNEVLFTGAYGEANKDFHFKNALDTRFNICSGTKPFTAVATMLLVQRGLISVNDPVTKYLPDFPFGDKITIFQLLTHTSGLGHFSDTEEYIEKMNTVRGFQNVLDSFVYKEKLQSEPGTRFKYSNSGVRVLGTIIEKVTGMKYSDFIQQNILTPLGMKNTCHRLPEEIIENRASGYNRKYSGEWMETSRLVRPAGSETGLRTTVGDLFTFLQAVQSYKLLTEENTKTMLTPLAENVPYACLWEVNPGIARTNNNTFVGHGGAQPGFSSCYEYYLKDKYTIIVLSNYESASQVIFPRLESILFGKEFEMPKPGVDRFLYQQIKQNGFEKVSGNLLKILEDNQYNIKYPFLLNDAGYSLINEGDLEMAISLFKINVRLFPDDADVYDSLGEAYMKADNKELAVKNYKKSLELNPQNANAIEQINILK